MRPGSVSRTDPLPPLRPDFVVELAGPSDEAPLGVSALRPKMATYRTIGAQLRWLLLPHEQAVEIWRADNDEPVRIDLAEIWRV